MKLRRTICIIHMAAIRRDDMKCLELQLIFRIRWIMDCKLLCIGVMPGGLKSQGLGCLSQMVLGSMFYSI